MEELYLCYASEITGAAFATRKVENKNCKLGYDEFIRTREECEKTHIHSSIPNFKFDWEK